MEEKKLKIGNEDTAIIQIQASQSDPKKALAELVENCIDANAKNIEILRHRKNKNIEIVITDDGEGVKAGKDGNSDMDRIPTSICDSIKKQLDDKDKEKVIGEFAIGLLGFAAIGQKLEMISQAESSSKTKYLILTKGSTRYESGDSKNKINHSGTILSISPIHSSVTPLLTAEKINKYLGEELCERIRQTQTKIIVEDRVGRKKKIEIKPLDYKGEKIPNIDRVITPSGNIKFKLFIAQQGENGKVSIFRRGTKVIDDVTEIDSFNCEPWNNPLLEGLIDDRFINVPPATRKGILQDEKFEELIEAKKSIEDILISILKDAQEQREKELSRDIIKSLRDTFDTIMHDLSDEYNWFGSKGGLGVADRDRQSSGGERLKTKLALGPLESVTITPKVTQITPNEKKKFIAKAWTDKNELIPIDVVYKWSVNPNSLGTLEKNNNECCFTSGQEEGELKINLKASLKNNEVEASSSVLILKNSNKKSQSGFPRPMGEHKPSEKWRSYYNETLNTLVYNTGHNDYKKADGAGKKSLFKYLCYLYAKYLVLHNFKESGEDAVLERMIEVINHIEIK